jgi:hypothetical protein
VDATTYTVGVKSDGTVVAAGTNYNESYFNLTEWTGIVEVAAAHSHTVGLKCDGTVVATGACAPGGCDVTDWELAVINSDLDCEGPSLNITSHANNQQVTSVSITLAGTATDSGKGDSGIQKVTVNGVRASGDTATGTDTANWSKELALQAGANTITAVAYDNSAAHNSTTKMITLHYVPSSNVRSIPGILLLLLSD